MATHTIEVMGTDKTVEIDDSRFSEEFYAYLVKTVLGIMVNKLPTGKNKLQRTKASEAQLFANAQTNVEALYAEKTSRRATKKKAKGDSVLRTEMLRIAKLYAKEQVRQGAIRDDKGNLIKVSKVSAAEWTRTANAYIEANEEHFRKAAEANLAAASMTFEGAPKIVLNEEPKLVAKAAKAAQDKKAAKQGKSAPPPAKQKGGKPLHA